MGRGPRPCRGSIRSRRYGELVFIGFTDEPLCRRAERLGIRVFYAPHGERTACYVRAVDARLVCGDGGEHGGGSSSGPGGGGSSGTPAGGAVVGDTSPGFLQAAGYKHGVVDAVPAAAASVIESATASTRATDDDRALFERILKDVVAARRGARRATSLSASLSRDLVLKLDELSKELGVNTSRLVDALLRFALVKLGYLSPPE